MEIKGFIPTSLVDWDGKVSAVLFLPGCSFRCGFCSNKELVPFSKKLKAIPFEKIQEALGNNKMFVDGIVITGGEPTIHKDLPELCMKLKSMGFAVKVDTNGSNPKMLHELLERKFVDCIAMDIKTSFRKYRKATKTKILAVKIKKSIEIVKQFPDYEFRITCVPGLVDEEDLLRIAKYLKSKKANRKFVLQQFRNKECLDEKFEKIKPYPNEQIKEFCNLVNKYFESCKVRNI